MFKLAIKYFTNILQNLYQKFTLNMLSFFKEKLEIKIKIKKCLD